MIGHNQYTTAEHYLRYTFSNYSTYLMRPSYILDKYSSAYDCIYNTKGYNLTTSYNGQIVVNNTTFRSCYAATYKSSTMSFTRYTSTERNRWETITVKASITKLFETTSKLNSMYVWTRVISIDDFRYRSVWVDGTFIFNTTKLFFDSLLSEQKTYFYEKFSNYNIHQIYNMSVSLSEYTDYGPQGAFTSYYTVNYDNNSFQLTGTGANLNSMITVNNVRYNSTFSTTCANNINL